MLKKLGNFFFRLPCRNSPLSNKLHRFVPPPILKKLKKIKNKYMPISEMIRISKSVTKYLGPEYPPTYEKIEINVTYRCNLKCWQCNRMLDIAPCNQDISLEQIDKFINNSISQKHKWKDIYISGGEPSLHPHIFEIVEKLISYKKNYSTETNIFLITNGTTKESHKITNKFSPMLRIYNSAKHIDPIKHSPICVAPVDIDDYKNADFSNGCIIPMACGIGLSVHGYYICAVAAAIDRIFGFDVGRKKLPDLQDNMIDQYRLFCGLCGHFTRSARSQHNMTTTRSWEVAIAEYKKNKPSLTLY